jgi:hypothetical protein
MVNLLDLTGKRGQARPRRRIRLSKAAFKRALSRAPLIGNRLNRAKVVQRCEAFLGEPLAMDPPAGFNALIVHRLIYDRDPMLKRICDKIAVRGVIRERLGEDYVTPIIGCWDSPDEIPWHALPDRFVLKPSHTSGPVAIIREKSSCDFKALAEQAQEWLQHDYFDLSPEWGYRGIPRRVLAEPLLVGANGGGVPEANVMTFHGQTVAIRIYTGAKHSPDRLDNWFDVHGARLPFHSLKYRPGDFVLAPEMARRLAAVSAKAAAGFSHMRVDIYLTDQGLRIGELTPYHGAGQTKWSHPGCDRLFGRLWQDPALFGSIRDMGVAITEA